MYRVAYFPYPRPSDLPAYRNEKSLYPGLLALQEPVSQIIRLYRFEDSHDGGNSYTIYEYSKNSLDSELRIEISTDYAEEYRADDETVYGFMAYSRVDSRAVTTISGGLLTRTGEIRWDQRKPDHWAYQEVVALIEFFATTPVKRPERLAPGQVITWDIPLLLAPELIVSRNNFERHLLHWFAVQDTNEFGWFAHAPLTGETYPSVKPPHALVHIMRPRRVVDRYEEDGTPHLLGYVAQVEGGIHGVLKWGKSLEPTLWTRSDEVGLAPGLTGHKLPAACRALVEAEQLRYPDP